MRTLIKICGLARLDDALLAAESGADYLGFIFAPGSPRQLTPEAAKDIVSQLPPEVKRVGVFRDAPLADIRKIMEFLTAVDLPVTLEQLGIECSEENLDIIAEHTVDRNALIHHEPVAVDRDLVKNAIVMANVLGHDWLDSHK